MPALNATNPQKSVYSSSCWRSSWKNVQCRKRGLTSLFCITMCGAWGLVASKSCSRRSENSNSKTEKDEKKETKSVPYAGRVLASATPHAADQHITHSFYLKRVIQSMLWYSTQSETLCPALAHLYHITQLRRSRELCTLWTNATYAWTKAYHVSSIAENYEIDQVSTEQARGSWQCQSTC